MISDVFLQHVPSTDEVAVAKVPAHEKSEYPIKPMHFHPIMRDTTL
jgi:hypothetical protein